MLMVVVGQNRHTKGDMVVVQGRLTFDDDTSDTGGPCKVTPAKQSIC
jgi:hypothetical protein